MLLAKKKIERKYKSRQEKAKKQKKRTTGDTYTKKEARMKLSYHNWWMNPAEA